MRIYGGARRLKIFGKGIADDKRILKNITDILKISEKSNLSQLIIKLAKIRLAAPYGVRYLAFVVEERYIEIYCQSDKLPKIVMIVRLDGEKTNPNFLKKTIIDSVIAFSDKMRLTPFSRQLLLTRLKEMREGQFC